MADILGDYRFLVLGTPRCFVQLDALSHRLVALSPFDDEIWRAPPLDNGIPVASSLTLTFSEVGVLAAIGSAFHREVVVASIAIAAPAALVCGRVAAWFR